MSAVLSLTILSEISRILDAEGAAEAAADLRSRQLGQPQALDRRQQLARLLLDAELAQAGAGVVIGDGAVEARRHAGNAAHVREERDQLVGPRRQRLGALLHRGVIGEQRRVVLADHAGAGAAGRHHIVVGLEGGDDPRGDGAGIGAIAGIVGRLAAAGLRPRHLDRAAGLLQQLDGGKADRRPEQIDEAGDEQADADWRLAHGGNCGTPNGWRDNAGCPRLWQARGPTSAWPPSSAAAGSSGPAASSAPHNAEPRRRCPSRDRRARRP